MGGRVLVYGSFQNIVPQTVAVELPDDPFGDNWLLESLLNPFEEFGLNLYRYKRQGLELYMSLITLCSNDNAEQQTSKNIFPYLQPVNNLSEQDLAGLKCKPMIEADTFYRMIFEESSEIKFLHGERLYALADHLRFVGEIRNLFPAYSERACELFCEETNSTLDFGSLLIYFHVLKKYFNIEQVECLEEKLRQRLQAEQTFLEYFYDPEQVNHANIRKWASVHPYVFFLSFVKVFLFHTQSDRRKEQQECINRLVDTLEFFPKLKELLTCQRITPEMYFHEFLYKKLTTSTKSAPLDQLKRICSSDWGNVLSGASQIRFQSYEKSSLIKVRALSRGSQANVELVTAPGLPVPVAAKLFVGVSPTSYGLHEAFLQTKNEIHTLLAMQCNPHIISLYGYVVQEHTIRGLLMEYCKGGSLDSVITSAEGYSESSIIRWSLHAASGLDFIHTSNTIHRDVKPNNMLLDEYHQLLKIGDLGIVKMGTIISDVLHCENTSDCGTPGYRAPECIYGDVDTCTPKLDVFGLGRSIWKMIFRCSPNEPLDSGLAMKVTVSPTIWAYVQRMMAIDPESRPNMAEVYKFFEGQEQPSDDIATQPANKVVFNAPFDEKLTNNIKITNFYDHRIGWTIKPSNMKRLAVNSAFGCLEPKETTVIAVSCRAFAYKQEKITRDYILIEWTGIPRRSAKQYSPEWFQDAGLVSRKNLAIEYNL